LKKIGRYFIPRGFLTPVIDSRLWGVVIYD
jgi:hypothetical protein